MGAVVITLVVGASRLYLGAHWLNDVLAGYALGAAWSGFLTAASLLAMRQGRRRAMLSTAAAMALRAVGWISLRLCASAWRPISGAVIRHQPWRSRTSTTMVMCSPTALPWRT